jgi:nucleotidyltransferase AbiEii toxin of type IV toxin-antitoxin system
MKEFSPRLEILPAAQRRLWSEFSGVPEEFVLYGGTAVALHLGHRHSIDFDFFGNRALDPSVKKIASLLDLAGTKASVLQVRAEAKDYTDMDALMTIGKITLRSLSHRRL